MSNFIRLLNQYGRQITDDIRPKVPVATGKTRQSLKYQVKEQGTKIALTITGRPFFMTVETGRKPTPEKNPSPQMVKNIREWMQATGKEGSPYGLAKAIQLKGTKLWRQGGKKDVVSNVINESLINRINKDVLELFAKDFLNHTKELWQSQ